MSITNEKIDAGLYVQAQSVNANFDLALFVLHTRSFKVFGLFVFTQELRILSTQANSCVFRIWSKATLGANYLTLPPAYLQTLNPLNITT